MREIYVYRGSSEKFKRRSELRTKEIVLHLEKFQMETKDMNMRKTIRRGANSHVIRKKQEQVNLPKNKD